MNTATVQTGTSSTKSVNSGFAVEDIRRDFPILSRKINGQPLIFLDSAASSQMPSQVIRAFADYQEKHHANVHRGLYTLSAEATELYENSRVKVAKFLGAASPNSIVFTRNATEALNLVAYCWAAEQLKPGDEILISRMEHHANLVPWVRICEKTGALLKTIPLGPEGRLDLTDLDSLLNERTKLVALTRMSNALGVINDLSPIFARAREVGARTLVDAAQSAPHMTTDVQALDCDFLAISAHKMLGPSGVGALYARQELLESMPPFISGGEMIDEVSFERVTYNMAPHKFEAGTPNIVGVVAFAAAIDYLNKLGMDNIRAHEIEITAYALKTLAGIPQLKIFGPLDVKDRGSAISFTLGPIHPHDVAQHLDSLGIAVRAGHHCAQPLMKELGVQATTRASFYVYNTLAEVDRLRDGLLETQSFFSR